MKSRLIAAAIAAASLALLSTGCGRQETKTPAEPTAKTTAGKTMDEAQKAATAVADQAKKAAETMAAETKQAVGKLTAETTKQSQGAIDKAKTLIGEKKYQDALTALSQLVAANLTPEQKKLVEELKAEAQRLMSSDLGKAAEGMLKKK
jgi:ElaB/YqjD/DUF883 family membrane-anchored ribosome-binding protein